MYYLYRERILKLFELDWLDLNFQNQKNGLMSPDGVCTISVSPAGDETILEWWIGFFKEIIHLGYNHVIRCTSHHDK